MWGDVDVTLRIRSLAFGETSILRELPVAALPSDPEGSPTVSLLLHWFYPTLKALSCGVTAKEFLPLMLALLVTVNRSLLRGRVRE